MLNEQRKKLAAIFAVAAFFALSGFVIFHVVNKWNFLTYQIILSITGGIVIYGALLLSMFDKTSPTPVIVGFCGLYFQLLPLMIYFDINIKYLGVVCGITCMLLAPVFFFLEQSTGEFEDTNDECTVIDFAEKVQLIKEERCKEEVKGVCENHSNGKD